MLFEKYDKDGDSTMDFDEYHEICRASATLIPAACLPLCIHSRTLS